MTKRTGNSIKCFGLIAAIMAIGLAFLTSCTEEPSANTGPRTRPSAPVTVAPVKQLDMPITVDTVGNVEAYNIVSVKSQVGGVLTAVYFSDGQEVKEGDLLFSIDSAPYEVTLKQVQAQLAKDQALALDAQAELRRNAALVERGVVSRQDFDTMKAKADSLEAAVQGDKALIEKAKLDIGYCSIKAPISGRTGSIQLRKGTLVKANDDNRYLVTIAQIEPIFVNFTIPEKFIGQINAGMARDGLIAKFRIPESPEDTPPVEGQVTFVDNAVDVSTGTIVLKATVPNVDRHLWPGLFVNVTLNLGVDSGALVVPNSAVQSGQAGPFVFVVGPENTAEMRPVVVSRLTREDAVIKQGVKPGEQVVTDGQLNVTPGAKVSIKDEKALALGAAGGGRTGGPGSGQRGAGRPGEKPGGSEGPGGPAAKPERNNP